VNILLEHESGVATQVHLNFIQRPNQRTLRLIGSKGTMYWDFSKPEVKVFADGEETTYSFEHDASTLSDQSYTDQMRHFVSVVQKKVEPKVPLQKGIENLTLCLDILKEIRNQ